MYVLKRSRSYYTWLRPQTFHQRRRDWSSGRLLSTLSTGQKKTRRTDRLAESKQSYCQCGYVSLSKILFDLFLSINNEIIEFIQ